jgi:rRNA biogenesis protein RRP5
VIGTRLLTRVHTVLPLHLILSLPNNLLAHVPITEISTTLTNLLTAEAEDNSDEETPDAGSSSSTPSAPDLAQLFTPGQYFPARVLQTYPTASQSFISQYPMTEVSRLAARVELTLVPEKVNVEVGKGEVGEKGFFLVGEVQGEEDKGWRVGLGVEGGMEGWVPRDDAERFIPGTHPSIWRRS